MALQKVFKGLDSPFTFIIKDIAKVAYTAAMMARITRALLKYTPSTGADPEYADSDESDCADAFDWETYEDDGRLVVDLGMLDLTVGRDRTAELIIYDATYTNGRVIAQLDIQITEEGSL